MKHTVMNAAARQRGVSFIGVLIVVGALAFLGVLGAQVLPTLLEYQSILKAVEKAKVGNTPAEVRNIFERASAVDDIKSVTPKDLEIGKDGDKVVVSFAYNREFHMFGPAWLVMKYVGKSK